MKLFFEVYPPKTEEGLPKLYAELDKLMELKPDMISVTHGANGSNVGRQLEVLRYIKEHGCPAMANVTCIDKTKEDIRRFVEQIESIGVDRIMAIRGDIPRGRIGTGGDCQHANELIRCIRNYTDVPVAAACYPEGHIEDISPDDNLWAEFGKEQAGADLFISQMCYEVDAIKKEYQCDTVIGIMPVLDRERVTEMALKNGVSIPKELARIMGRYWDDPDGFRKAGKEYTVKIANWLIGNGTDKFQIFTMNRADDVIEIVRKAGIR